MYHLYNNMGFNNNHIINSNIFSKLLSEYNLFSSYVGTRIIGLFATINGIVENIFIVLDIFFFLYFTIFLTMYIIKS